MDEHVKHALERDRTIDITARGRKTGPPRRTELWFHHVKGQLYMVGTPRRRDWSANLLAHPACTFHLKQSARADLQARVTPIQEKARRRALLPAMHQQRGGHAIRRHGERRAPWWKWSCS
jgi:deazaflavin-dependent oxidoreductase (nitroreductase family)